MNSKYEVEVTTIFSNGKGLITYNSVDEIVYGVKNGTEKRLEDWVDSEEPRKFEQPYKVSRIEFNKDTGKLMSVEFVESDNE